MGMGGGTERMGWTNVILNMVLKIRNTRLCATHSARIVVGLFAGVSVPTSRSGGVFDPRTRRGHIAKRARTVDDPTALEACFRTRRAGGAGGNRARASSIRSAAARRARRDAIRGAGASPRDAMVLGGCSARWRDGRRTSTRCASRPSIAPRRHPRRVSRPPPTRRSPPAASLTSPNRLLPPRPQFGCRCTTPTTCSPAPRRSRCCEAR